MTYRSILFAGAALALAGCTVGPTYRPPEAAPPAQFAAAQPTPTPGPDVDLSRWWTAFGDPQLSGLIERALKDSPDIAVAASRVREARLGVISAGAAALPTLDATGDASFVRFSKNAGFSQLAQAFSGGGSSSGGDSGGGTAGGVALPGDSIRTYGLGFDASWELDVFGGVRRSVEAAKARVEGAEWSRRDAAITLAAEVAQVYMSLRLDQQQIALVQQEIEAQRASLKIAGEIAKAGLVPPIDVTRQRGSITATQARLEPLRADARVRAHALGVLVGAQPEALLTELDTSAPPVMAPVPVVPAGLPSELLRRRPDVRAAERDLAASTADIGVAVSDLYPKFSLTGIAQLISTALGNLFTANSLQLTADGAARFPIFDGGRRRATVDQRREEREQAYQRYRSTVLGALRDVEDPLARLDAERRRNATLQSASRDAEATTRSVEARYRSGFVAQDSLLDAQAQELSTREQLVASDAQLRLDTISLFKALGGGWEQAGEVPARPAAD